MKKDRKSEQINIRLTKSEKELLEKSAERNGQSISEFIINIIKDNNRSESYEQYVTNTLVENQLINDLLVNDVLSDKAKRIISKEARKYV